MSVEQGLRGLPLPHTLGYIQPVLCRKSFADMTFTHITPSLF
jgi:hypothetical protein